MARHELKTDPAVFGNTWDGYKPWEIRFNDRDYKSGDDLVLRETKHTGVEMAAGAPLIYTGREIDASIVMIPDAQPNYGLAEGFIVFTTSVNNRRDDGGGERDA